MPIVLPGTGLPTIPDDDVHFTVDVDQRRCPPPSAYLKARLDELATNGFTTQLSRIIAFSGIHFQNAVVDHWEMGFERARIAASWGVLSHWEPRREISRKGIHRMVISKRPNPNVQRTVAELLGVGGGLLLARHLYQRPYRSWRPLGHGRMDYVASTPQGGQTIRVEVRGRVDRKGWQAAIDQVEDKITAGSPFDYNAGIIFAPRSGVNARTADFLVMDPEGDGSAAGPLREYRDTLLHYAPYFLQQGFRVFGSRLLELAEVNDDAFKEYIIQGDEILRQAISHRVRFRINDSEYLGTAWEGIRWPPHLIGQRQASEGAFFDGIAEVVIRALTRGALRDIVDMAAPEGSVRVGEYSQVTLDDGRGSRSWVVD